MAGVTPRHMRAVVFVCDVVIAALAIVAAEWFRYGDPAKIDVRSMIRDGIMPFTAAATISFLLLRPYRTSWRHVSTADLLIILQAATLTAILYVPLSFFATRLSEIPRSFIVLSWMILVVLLTGARVAGRLYAERRLVLGWADEGRTPILAIGGGVAAELFLRSLDGGGKYHCVGILDDDARATTLRGVSVLGGIADAEAVLERFGDSPRRPRKLVIVDKRLLPDTLARLVDLSNRLGVTVARAPDPTMLRPGVEDTVPLQPISVEDLLGRSQVVLDPTPVHALVIGKRVLVTGAGGSIGSEIVRQVCAVGPAAICLIDASEFNLYTIDLAVAEQWPELERVARVIDVRHRSHVEACFATFRPDIVFHAAALKHVPLVEANPVEGLWTNTIGSRHVCDAAVAAGCRAMVLISTDKAVNPTNVMGASKRGAESYCQALALAHAERPDATRFVAVRFGNVLGSTGSVVPLFERQLKAGGPLTVTHPDIERYFMTIREAVQLVLQASAMGASRSELAGRVFVLDMGLPVKIADLANQMIRLAGLRPGKDVSIRFTGLRPGEKLYEELFHEGERIEATSTPRVNVAAPRTAAYDSLLDLLDRMEEACCRGEKGDALQALLAMVPEYQNAEEGAGRRSLARVSSK